MAKQKKNTRGYDLKRMQELIREQGKHATPAFPVVRYGASRMERITLLKAQMATAETLECQKSTLGVAQILLEVMQGLGKQSEVEVLRSLIPKMKGNIEAARKVLVADLDRQYRESSDDPWAQP